MSEAEKPPVLCIYHGNCADGFTAAWAVHKRFGSAAEFYPGVYQIPPPDVVGRDVIMVDFSYKRAVLVEMARQAHSLIVLDHHKTAAEDLAGFPSLVGIQSGESVSALGLAVLFDMNRSGAQIAWDFFHPGMPRPKLVDYVGDRDLWRFELPFSREINANIFSFDYDFKAWDHIDRRLRDVISLQMFADEGAAIERKHFSDIKKLLPVVTRRMVLGGFDVPVANLPLTFTSDAGHQLAKGEAFGACYWDTPEGRVFSLRSTGDFDVSAVAKLYGGGGHPAAAGFRMPAGWGGDRG